MTPEENLASLGLEIPDVATPLGSYLNASRSGNLLYISGGLPIMGDEKYLGKVPTECNGCSDKDMEVSKETYQNTSYNTFDKETSESVSVSSQAEKSSALRDFFTSQYLFCV